MQKSFHLSSADKIELKNFQRFKKNKKYATHKPTQTANDSFSADTKTVEESKQNDVFQFQMLTDRQNIKLGKDTIFTIKTAWVEHSWMYECIHNKAILKKGNLLQFVMDGDCNVKTYNDTSFFILWAGGICNFGILMPGQMSVEYLGQDTLTLECALQVAVLQKQKSRCRL